MYVRVCIQDTHTHTHIISVNPYLDDAQPGIPDGSPDESVSHRVQSAFEDSMTHVLRVVSHFR
jgi:hypothetical protein